MSSPSVFVDIWFFPHYITEIGSGAFEWCSSLTSVVISENITKINFSTYLHGKYGVYEFFLKRALFYQKNIDKRIVSLL